MATATAAKIQLRKLTGISIDSGSGPTALAADAGSGGATPLKTEIGKLSDKHKVVFAGQDYKGTFTATEAKSGTSPNEVIKGKLELYLERPENHFTITGVKIDLNATSGAHTFKGTGKDGGATIVLAASTPTITEKDSGWFTTELTATPQTLKFGEWSNYDLSNQSYVDISFV